MHQWSALAAWILSLSNVYLIFVLIADYRLTKLNPVVVTERLIRIRIAHDIWTDIGSGSDFRHPVLEGTAVE
ncbi:hypothetical protein [Paenibacillus thiaminolyticus]|uniref:Uncharacterized protein n=1 Tax=Paenibacillus thiaminolyticus TaxID=49283 RepID=A0A3A3GAD2_PANTH|nr:hypothetical protein [Paenibacillus thiaminolyticus]RJG15460.1 hypothetical protein DQX05_29750 [Paenibacillus thiaminolyticus]